MQLLILVLMVHLESFFSIQALSVPAHIPLIMQKIDGAFTSRTVGAKNSSSDFESVLREAGTHSCCAETLGPLIAAAVSIVHVDMSLCELHLTMRHLSRVTSVISQAEGVFNKLEWKSIGSNYLAESEQVPLPATALIASALLQISNQTNIGIAGIQMRR